MWNSNRMLSKYIALVFLVQSLTADTNALACSKINYRVKALGCYELHGLGSWKQTYLKKICPDSGKTDKSTTATLCSSNEEHEIALKLAILNHMYGTGRIQEDCKYHCMYDPFDPDKDDALTFLWVDLNKCWKVIVGKIPVCHQNNAYGEWQFAINKTKRWCPGTECQAYGDPHVFNFDGIGVPMEHSLGDYMMYRSSTMRVDVRSQHFYSNQGVLYTSVTGIHATAIQVIGGNCEVKLEVYSKHQTESKELRFLFNEVDIGWDELVNSFASCDEICKSTDLYEIDEEKKQFTVTFADGVMITLRNLENMHAIYITVPPQTIQADTTFMNEKQLCTGDRRLLDCEDDSSIFTYYAFDEELGRHKVCNETEREIIDPPNNCDPNIQSIARDVCSECDAPCVIPALVESCEFDICFIPGVIDGWNVGNETKAYSEARVVADEYCTSAKEEIKLKPWLCPLEETSMPTKDLGPLPTRYPTNAPTLPPTLFPTELPTTPPTLAPTDQPTFQPTGSPTVTPTVAPSQTPTNVPTVHPTLFPTGHPTFSPTFAPTDQPTIQPTEPPTFFPTFNPTPQPTQFPTFAPSPTPTYVPTLHPTLFPTERPTVFVCEDDDDCDGQRCVNTKVGPDCRFEKRCRQGVQFVKTYQSCACIHLEAGKCMDRQTESCPSGSWKDTCPKRVGVPSWECCTNITNQKCINAGGVCRFHEKHGNKCRGSWTKEKCLKNGNTDKNYMCCEQ